MLMPYLPRFVGLEFELDDGRVRVFDAVNDHVSASLIHFRLAGKTCIVTVTRILLLYTSVLL